MSRVSVSLMILLLGGDARAFLAEGLDVRLVLIVLLGSLFGGGPAAVAAGREGIAAAVGGIVRHLVVLVERSLGRIGIVVVLGHRIVLEGVSTFKPAAGWTG